MVGWRWREAQEMARGKAQVVGNRGTVGAGSREARGGARPWLWRAQGQTARGKGRMERAGHRARAQPLQDNERG
jgi:hypothetical protein